MVGNCEAESTDYPSYDVGNGRSPIQLSTRGSYGATVRPTSRTLAGVDQRTIGRIAVTAGAGFASAVVVGGAVGVGLCAGLVVVEAVITARRGFLPADSAPAQDIRHPPGSSAVTLALLGDSTAAGVGVRRPDDTVGRQLAARIVRTGRPVALTSAAVSGSRAADLGPQVSRALLHHPTVAVILLGVGDALRLTALGVVAEQLGTAVRRLRAAGVQVVVGTCPDLGAAPAWPQPLRTLIGHRGRELAAAQAGATTRAGGVAVDLAAATGGVFRADPGTFAEDGLHPSADGYRLWADALWPAVSRAGAASARL